MMTVESSSVCSDTTPRSLAANPERWVENYGDYLYSYAMLRLRDPDRAGDAVQETFMAALKSLDA